MRRPLGGCMVDRRAFITSTIAIATAVAVGNESAAATAPAPAESAVVLVDRSLAGSAALAAAARARGLETFEFTGDLAAVWMRELEPRLRLGPIAIEGYTSASTWFCLDLMARDFGARTLERSVEADAMRFVISQIPGRRAALAPAAVRTQWRERHA